MLSGKKEKQGELQIIQIVTALCSLVFIYFIARGYFILLQKVTPGLAITIGMLFALIAWFIAKFIGSQENGIRRYRPLFILLLVISALGIFNALLAQLESKTILTEAVQDSADRFNKLKLLAEREQKKRGITEQVNQVNTNLMHLIQQINNPLKCGQGQLAMQDIKDIQSLLPGFYPLLGDGNSCAQSAKLIASYKDQVAKLLPKASWNDPELQQILSDTQFAAAKLNDARQEAKKGSESIVTVTQTLENLAPIYQNNYQKISKYITDPDLPAQLDLVEVESIGEWSQVINLFISRVDKPSTWVYIFLAIFADWMMVYLWGLIREKKGSINLVKKNEKPRFGKL